MDQAGEITLRPGTAADADAVARIWYPGWKDGHLGHVPDELALVRTEESFHTRAADRVADTTVAVVGGEVAGFIVVVADEVEQVYVDAHFRGAGVADVLLAEAERLVRSDGHPRAWLAVVAGNARALAFYTRQGWSDDGEHDLEFPGPNGTIRVPTRRYVKDV